jgi:hypothetical protein
MAKFHIELLPDLDSRSASNLLSLVKTCKSNECSIALGAGMSVSVGLPSWDKFLRRISYAYFEHWIHYIFNDKKNCDYKSPPQNISIAFTEGYDVQLFMKELEKEYENNASYKNTKYSISEIIKDSINSGVKMYVNGHQLSDDKIKSFLEKQAEITGLEEILQESFLNSLMSKNPLLVAQLIKNRIKEKDWNYLLRKALYGSYENTPFQLNISPFMDSCINLIKSSDIKNIVNYNYDDTMYHALLKCDVKFNNFYCGKVNSSKPCIYYPHGYIPFKGGVNTEIVLTETEYQKQSSQADLWSNNIQISVYCNTSCIFLGLSLEDPNLRRILNLSNTATQRNHYAFLPRSTGNGPVPEMIDSLFDVDLLRFGIKTIRYPLIDGSHDRLSQIINLTVEAIRDEIKLV